MVLPLLLGIFLLIVLYFYFWYITIPATIIIIVTLWLYNKRCNDDEDFEDIFAEERYWQRKQEEYYESFLESMEGILTKSEAYKELGLPITATIEQVKKRFRNLVLKWHPDRNKTKKTQANEKFVKIRHAYETIIGAA